MASPFTISAYPAAGTLGPGRTAPIPPELDQAVLACLAKDPTARPQSARELSSGLGDIAGAAAWTKSVLATGGPGISLSGL